uniref:Uncharacterized protein n=1 Tax=Lepeophtheirus salmonis TaxID=72036 RepID=A0A0K2V996_LEPSM
MKLNIFVIQLLLVNESVILSSGVLPIWGYSGGISKYNYIICILLLRILNQN